MVQLDWQEWSQKLEQYAPDLTKTAGRVFSVTLVSHHDKLHFVSSVKFNSVVHFRHVEEQLLAFFGYHVVEESKLFAMTQNKTNSVNSLGISPVSV